MSKWQTGIIKGHSTNRANLEGRQSCRIEKKSNEHR